MKKRLSLKKKENVLVFWRNLRSERRRHLQFRTAYNLQIMESNDLCLLSLYQCHSYKYTALMVKALLEGICWLVDSQVGIKKDLYWCRSFLNVQYQLYKALHKAPLCSSYCSYSAPVQPVTLCVSERSVSYWSTSECLEVVKVDDKKPKRHASLFVSMSRGLPL